MGLYYLMLSVIDIQKNQNMVCMGCQYEVVTSKNNQSLMNIQFKFIFQMNQTCLTNYSVIAIKYILEDKAYYMGNHSFIRSQLYFRLDDNQQNSFQNFLFYVQTIKQTNLNMKNTIQFQQLIMLRHKLSSKYLSYITAEQGEQTDELIKLELSQKITYFKFKPCFQYQTKISKKVKFNEQIYLQTALKDAKQMHMLLKSTNTSKIQFIPVLDMKYKSKLTLHSYHQIQKQSLYYSYGQILWIQNIEHENFITVVKSDQDQKILFENVNIQDQLQSINGLWLLQSINQQIGGYINYNQPFYLKNIGSQKYLSLSAQNKINKGTKAILCLQNYTNQCCKFVFQSLIGEESKIKHNRYLKFKNFSLGVYIGSRSTGSKYQYQKYRDPLTFDFFEDQDLYQLVNVKEQYEQLIRFIFSISKQLKYIKKLLQDNKNTTLSTTEVKEIQKLFNNTIDVLKKLQGSKNFIQVQEEVGPFMHQFFVLIVILRNHLQQAQNINVISVIHAVYKILAILCKNYSYNQIIAYNYLSTIIEDVFKDYGAEQLICQIFIDNYNLLCKISIINHSLNNKFLIESIILKIYSYYNTRKSINYWNKILKIFNLFKILMRCKTQIIDRNQKKFAQTLFSKDMYFQKIFLSLKISQQRIKIQNPFTKKWIQIQRVKQPILRQIVQNIFYLFSWLCEDRNLLSKIIINKYISSNNKEGLQIIMSYLSAQISQQLSNCLFSFLTSCYVDSTPKIKRHKPLSIITFAIDPSNGLHQYSFQNQAQLMKQKLLNKRQYYNEQKHDNSAKKLTISNQIEIVEGQLQPNLNEFQLDCYKNELKQKIKSGNWSYYLTKSICKLIELQNYEIDQIIEIIDSINNSFLTKTFQKDVIAALLQILSQINMYCQQLQLKKITAYLKYRFTFDKKSQFQAKQLSYLLPNSPNLQISSSKSRNQAQPFTSNVKHETKLFIQQFNMINEIILKISSVQKLKHTMIKIFLDDESSQFYMLESMFKTMFNYNYCKYNIVNILSRCIVITNQQVDNFAEIFQMYLKMKRLLSITQIWLVNDETGQQQHKQFCYYLFQFTNFFFNNYVINSSRDTKVRKIQPININRQLLVANLYIHLDVIKLLQSNYYMLQFTNASIISKRQLRVFQMCFQFLYYFCNKCPQNIDILTQSIQIFHKFIGLIEVGQLKLINLIYRISPNLQKIIQEKQIKKIINKIIKNIEQENSDNLMCEYNPDSLELLIILCIYKEKPNKKNLEIIFNIIIKENVFRKIMFFKQPFRGYQLQISYQNFKKSPQLQVPLLYHAKMMALISLIIQNLNIQGILMIRKVKQTIGLEQLLNIIALPDIFSHQRGSSDINFILKHQVIKLFKICIEQKKQLDIKLLQSQSLFKVLIFYKSILIQRLQPKILNQDVESYLQFLNLYQTDLFYNRHNLRDYYQIQIKQLFLKIKSCFQNYKNCNKNKNYKLLLAIMDGIQLDQLTQNHLLKQTIYGIDQIQIKWRNFVDADTNNSDQEKFSKRFLLQFLRHQKTYQCLEQEQNIFMKYIHKNSKNYLKIVSRFIKLASVQLNQSVQVYQPFLTSHKLLQNLQKYLVKNKEDIKFQIREQYQDLISNLLDFILQQRFQYNHNICRKILYQILTIYNFLFQNDEENYLVKHFYKHFQQNSNCNRLFLSLRQALKQIFNINDSQVSYEQINMAMKQIYICGEQRIVQIEKQSLKFLSHLCKHLPFTQFLRSQPYNSSIDFLQEAYNCLYYLLNKDSQNIMLNIRIVDISEYILQFFISMMNGYNTINQHFIIDSKFPHIVTSILKLQYLIDYRNKSELARRGRIVEQLLQFYESNGISIKNQISQKLNIQDFRAPYILNRFKYSLLKVLYQSIMNNERNLAKIKVLIPIQIMKINIIEIYLQIKKINVQYSQSNILRERQRWHVIEKSQNQNHIFLMVGFYIYQLLQLYDQSQQAQQFQEQLQVIDEQKLKQNLVKNFFHAINIKKKKYQKLRLLENQQYAEQLKYYFDIFYNACSYFQKKVRYIEANVYGKLIKIFFPIIPLTQKLSKNMMDKFQEEATRINHDEKIKSLMNFEHQAFQFLEGQQNYLKSLQQKSIILEKITTVIKNEQNLFLVMWLNSIIVVVLYVLHDYQYPQHEFSVEIGDYTRLRSFNEYALIIFIYILFFLATLNLINLIFRKIPFLMVLYSEKFEQSQEKELSGFTKNKIIYQISNIFSDILFDIYVILCGFTSPIHPLFAGFLLLYIIKRITLGKQIIKAIAQTWLNLFVVTGLLVVFDFVFAILIYSASFTTDIGYGQTCKTLFTCLLMIFDQSFKAKGGFLQTNNANFQNLTIQLKVFAEILYVLLAQKVIFQIFAGTIIDKFSQLRQKGNSIQTDQKQRCFICGQDRFHIDFELEGFQQHIQNTHNKMNYIYYLFYLRKKPIKEYTIQEHFIRNFHKKKNNSWIPDETSVLNIIKQKMQVNRKKNQTDQLQEFENYYSNKLQQAKRLRIKAQHLKSQINEELCL